MRSPDAEGGGGGGDGGMRVEERKTELERGVDSRSIFVAAVEDKERVGFAKEILLVQFVATELHHH